MRTIPIAIGLFMVLAAPLHAQLPETTVDFDPERTAIVITDPQNDFLHEDGVAWGAVGESVVANGTRDNLEVLMEVAKETSLPLVISPHYYYPSDHEWSFGGPLEVMMHAIGMFDREGHLHTDDLEGSGADWLQRYKPYIEDEGTIVTNPHKVYGPESNDLVLQLRKRGITKVILAGMSANLCTESHLRELLEQGFEVAVVSDGTAAVQFPELDGYQAAMTNFQFIANEVLTTAEVVQRVQAAASVSAR
jgi:biuret amidohydrolase